MSLATICTCGMSLNGYCNTRVKECTQLIKNEPQLSNMSDKQYINALEAKYFDHQLYPGDTIKIYGKETTIIGFSAQYNDGLEKWETIIHTVGRGDPFERSLDVIEILEEQPRSWEERTKSVYKALHPSKSAGVRPPFKVILKTGEVHEVTKYIKDTDGEEHIWCREWYGHHRIGHDCEWHFESAGVPAMRLEDHEQFEINKAAGMPEYEASFQSGYTAGHDAGYAKAKRESAGVGAVWVKATNPLGITQWYIVKCDHKRWASLIYVDSNITLERIAKDLEVEVDKLWYLDESAPPAQSGKEDAVAFAEWLWQNRWFHFENGKWYYTFEMGTAISDKSYQKNYVKTTAQLYDIYQSKK